MSDVDAPFQAESVTPRIVTADRLSDGLVLKFEDGQCGFFSDTLLFSKLYESESLREDQVEW